MIKRVALVGFAVLALSACAGEGASGINTDIGYMDRPDGGQVECATSEGGGIDCNWEGSPIYP